MLGNFYQVIKTKGALLRFVFITGVTRYAMVNEFSGLNNLNNISMDTDYATMLGYTQKELEENFAGSIGQGVKDTGMGREAYLAKVRPGMRDGVQPGVGGKLLRWERWRRGTVQRLLDRHRWLGEAAPRQIKEKR